MTALKSGFPPHDLHTKLVSCDRSIRKASGAIECEEKHVALLEDHLNILTRWVPTQPEYIAIQKDMTIRKYRSALDELERLIVQRLFELTKLNIAGTGE